MWGYSDIEYKSEPLIKHSGIVALEGCKFEGNRAATEGGAVSLEWIPSNGTQQSAPVIAARNCSFWNNSAPNGGALSVKYLSGALVLQNITASGNVAKLA